MSVKQALSDTGDKLLDNNKEHANKECEQAIKWLNNNTLAKKDEFEHKLDELQKVCSPLMMKLHGGSQSQGQQTGHGGRGPTVEEVD